MALRPLELAKAAIILVLGLAMIVAPSIGDDDAESYWTMPRLLAWAWSRPLGVLFTAVGVVGIYVFARVARRAPGLVPT